MSNFPHPPAPDDELSWLAFRYIANELTADDAARFELRLENDQAAREAVAAAVELTQATAWVEQEQAVPSRPAIFADVERRRRYIVAVGWMLAGSLACLAGLTLVDYFRGSRSRDLEGSRQLALAWSETRRDAEFADGAAFLDGDASPTTVSSSEQVSSDPTSNDLTSGHAVSRDELEDEMAEDATDGDQDDGMSDPMAAMSRATPSWMMAAVAEGDANGGASKTREEAKSRGEERPATQEP